MYIPEIANPQIKRVYCMAITDNNSSLNDGSPSSWSGAIDNLSVAGERHLFIISTGNTEYEDLLTYGYPLACFKKSVQDPAQAWNALTVGAYSVDVKIEQIDNSREYKAVAREGELSPYTSTSDSWGSQWAIKPDVVCDGGNVATDGTNFYGGFDELSKLTLSTDINKRLFDTISATSAATAQCSYIAAELLAVYPNMRQETVRALVVHSAQWTEAMRKQFDYLPDTKTGARRKLLRTCGYGVPDLDRAKDTNNNRVNMIIESEIQPYEKMSGSSPKMKEMHLHTLPWPNTLLQKFENVRAKIRVTLSYFIEPGPGQKGWKNKYKYASCGLRFDINRPNETVERFQQRINAEVRDDNYQNENTADNNWYLGSRNRDIGSIHSDIWEDSAINLAQCNYIAVYPISGWWKERTNLKKYNDKIRYSLIVTIETTDGEIDFYTSITDKIGKKIKI
jgi:hypothetical protein